MRHILCQAKEYWRFWQKNPVTQKTGTCIEHTPLGQMKGQRRGGWRGQASRAKCLCLAHICHSLIYTSAAFTALCLLNTSFIFSREERTLWELQMRAGEMVRWAKALAMQAQQSERENGVHEIVFWPPQMLCGHPCTPYHTHRIRTTSTVLW